MKVVVTFFSAGKTRLCFVACPSINLSRNRVGNRVGFQTELIEGQPEKKQARFPTRFPDELIEGQPEKKTG